VSRQRDAHRIKVRSLEARVRELEDRADATKARDARAELARAVPKSTGGKDEDPRLLLEQALDAFSKILSGERHAHKREVDTYTAKLQTAESQLATARAARDDDTRRFDDEFRTVEARWSTRLAQVEAERDAVLDRSGDMSRLGDAHTRDATEGELRSAVAALQRERDDLLAALDDAAAQLDTANADAALLRDRAQRAAAQAQRTEDLNEAKRRAARAEVARAEAAADADNKLAVIERLHRELAAERTELERVRADHAESLTDAVAGRDAKIAQLKTTAEELRARAASRTELASQLENELEALRDQHRADAARRSANEARDVCGWGCFCFVLFLFVFFIFKLK
jgi:hypothetical protein